MTNDKNTHTIRNLSEFYQWSNDLQGRFILYRGLADASWEVESSAYRRLKTTLEMDRVHHSLFKNYIAGLLDRTRQRKLGQDEDGDLPDLELLAKLQQYGAATCLIAFTKVCAIALWFACREPTDKPGKVVAVSTEDTDIFGTVSHEEFFQEDISRFLDEYRWWKWDPAIRNQNTLSHRTEFLFGNRSPAAPWKYLTIPSECKASIMEEFRELHITEENLFIDFPGFALLNAHDKPVVDFSAAENYIIGSRFHMRKKFAQAINHYTKAIALEPDIAEIYNDRAKAKEYMGDPAGAVGDYDKAIEIDPESGPGYKNRGRCKAALGDFQGAAADYAKAVEIDPEDAWACTGLANAKADSGDIWRAIPDYDKAIELDPNHAHAYYNRGNARLGLRDLKGAVADYDKAIELDQNLFEAYINRGNVRGDAGDFAGAIADHSKAIELQQDNAMPYLCRGNAKAKSGDFTSSIADYDKAIEIDPNYAIAYHNRGNAKRDSGDLTGAIVDYSRILEIDPNSAEVYYNRGNVKSESGDFAGAVADYDKAIEINPNFSEAHYNRDIARRQSGDLEGGQGDINRETEVNPDNGNT